jgi:hypothetical protein
LSGRSSSSALELRGRRQGVRHRMQARRTRVFNADSDRLRCLNDRFWRQLDRPVSVEARRARFRSRHWMIRKARLTQHARPCGLRPLAFTLSARQYSFREINIFDCRHTGNFHCGLLGCDASCINQRANLGFGITGDDSEQDLAARKFEALSAFVNALVDADARINLADEHVRRQEADSTRGKAVCQGEVPHIREVDECACLGGDGGLAEVEVN